MAQSLYLRTLVPASERRSGGIGKILLDAISQLASGAPRRVLDVDTRAVHRQVPTTAGRRRSSGGQGIRLPVQAGQENSWLSQLPILYVKQRKVA